MNRLTKYLTLFMVLLTSIPALAGWEYTEDIDAITGLDNSVAGIVYQDGYRQRGMLVRCNGNAVEVFFSAGDYIGSMNDHVRVDFRFDENQPVVGASYNLSTNGTAFFIPGNLKMDWIRNLVDNTSLYLRWYDYQGTPHETEISLYGSTSAITSLACTEGLMPGDDPDGDGIENRNDRCPFMAEDFDGFDDDDGCLDADNDADGVPDTQDECTDEREDFDGFEDDDGCLDPDNDRDGIEDNEDNCPLVANPSQEDLDEDGLGLACDPQTFTVNEDGTLTLPVKPRWK